MKKIAALVFATVAISACIGQRPAPASLSEAGAQAVATLEGGQIVRQIEVGDQVLILAEGSKNSVPVLALFVLTAAAPWTTRLSGEERRNDSARATISSVSNDDATYVFGQVHDRRIRMLEAQLPDGQTIRVDARPPAYAARIDTPEAWPSSVRYLDDVGTVVYTP